MLAATVVRPEVTSPEATQVRFVGRISALEIVYKRELVLAVAQWLACLKELRSAGAATKSAGAAAKSAGAATKSAGAAAKSAGAATKSAGAAAKSAGAATKSAGAATIAPGSAVDAASSVHGSKYGTTAGSKHGPAAAASKGSATANGSATAAAVAISAPRWSVSLDLKAEMPMLIFPLLPSHATSPRARYDAPTSGDPAGHSAVSSGAARSGSVRRRPTSRTGAAPSTAPPPDAHDGAMEEGASGRGGGAWSGVSSTPAEPRPNTAPNTAPTPLRALVLDFGRVACYHAPPAGFVRAGSSGGGAQYGAASPPAGAGASASRAPGTTPVGSGGPIFGTGAGGGHGAPSWAPSGGAGGGAAEGTGVDEAGVDEAGGDEAGVAGAPGGGGDGRWDLELIWAHMHAEVLSLPPTAIERAAPLSLLQGSVALGVELVAAVGARDGAPVGARDGAVTDGAATAPAGARDDAASAPTGPLGTALGLRAGAVALDLSSLEIVISSELSTAIISAHSQLTRAGRDAASLVNAASLVSAARASVQPPLGTAPPNSAVLGAASSSSSAHLAASVVTVNDSRHHAVTVNGSEYKSVSSEPPPVEADQTPNLGAREIESRAPRYERSGPGRERLFAKAPLERPREEIETGRNLTKSDAPERHRSPLPKPLGLEAAAAHAGGAHGGAFTDRGVEAHGSMVERLVIAADCG